MKKILMFLYPVLLFSCSSLFPPSPEDLEIKEIIILKEGDFSLTDSSILNAGSSYRFKLGVITQDNEIYEHMRPRDFNIQVITGNGSIKKERRYVKLRTLLESFSLALGEDILRLRISAYGLNRAVDLEREWSLDWSDFNTLSYSGDPGEDGTDGYIVETESEDQIIEYQEDGTPGEDGTDGSNVVLDVAVYDDGIHEPFLVIYERFSQGLFAYKSFPVTIKTHGGAGGNGGDGLTLFSDSPEGVSPGFGGDGGDGGRGGNVIVHSMGDLDVGSLLVFDTAGGPGGVGGDGGEDYQYPGFAILDALLPFDNGSYGEDGINGTVQFIVHDTPDQLFMGVKDSRFKREFLR